ncbi:MAG: hemerythrin domain-containing protein [Chitinophagaceae bacterium]|nr:hemerythrin domain-containing protein [Rubrivivax sp.]
MNPEILSRRNPTEPQSNDVGAGARADGGDDAVDMLTADHQEVRQLFADFELLADEDADAADRTALAQAICRSLSVHSALEEEIFYPAAREALNDDDLLDQAEADHAAADTLMAQIFGMDEGDSTLDETVLTLQELVEEHVREEESELFPRMQHAHLDLVALGDRMSLRKEELLAELDSQGDQ